MDGQIAQQIGIALVCVALGLSAWLLPYRWNIFRLKRLFRDLLPENVNRAVPKVIGTILLIAGVLILIGTAIIGKFE